MIVARQMVLLEFRAAHPGEEEFRPIGARAIQAVGDGMTDAMHLIENMHPSPARRFVGNHHGAREDHVAKGWGAGHLLGIEEDCLRRPVWMYGE